MRRAGPCHALTFGAALLVASAAATAQQSQDPDWPCIQRLVPEVSAGMVWAGPPVEEAGDWHDDTGISELAGKLASRSVPIGQAKTAFDAFARTLGNDKDRRLTQVFAGLLETVNQERASIIAGIKRYSRRQKALADKIADKIAALKRLSAGGAPDGVARRKELQEELVWDTRIFDERQRSLRYICEQPVLLEQRLFALARTIMTQLDE